jgi:hypothetical protein
MNYSPELKILYHVLKELDHVEAVDDVVIDALVQATHLIALNNPEEADRCDWYDMLEEKYTDPETDNLYNELTYDVLDRLKAGV